MNCMLATVADRVLRDAESNNVSIIHVIEQLTRSTDAFPATIPRVAILFVLGKEEGDPDEIVCDLKIYLNGEEIYQYQLATDFKGKRRARIVVELQGFVVPGTGNLRFAIEHNGEQLGGWNIDVRGGAASSPSVKVTDIEESDDEGETG